jgi:hypothetical protein
MNAFFFTVESTARVRRFAAALAVWTLAFMLARLPYAAELYDDAPLHRPGVPRLPLPIVYALFAALAACLIAFARRPSRALQLGVLALLAYLWGFDPPTLHGYGTLAAIDWALLWLAPYDRPRDERWGTRLLMLQFTSVYAFSVLGKLIGGSGWLDGNTLYNTWHGQSYGRFLVSAWLPLGHGAARLAGWLTLAAEALVAVGLSARATRRPAIATCLALHAAMALTLRVSILFHALMAIHLLLFWEE